MAQALDELVAGRQAWSSLTPLLHHAGTTIAAVAYATAADLIPLKRDDRILVNAEDATVRSGGTDPSVVAEWLDCGVQVRSYPGLQAKVVLAGHVSVAGSANASMNSEDNLTEAIHVSRRPAARKELATFLDSLWDSELTTQLNDAWVQGMRPMFNTDRHAKSIVPKQRINSVLPDPLTRLMFVESIESEEVSPTRAQRALTSSKQHDRRIASYPARFTWEQFQWDSSDVAVGDLVCQVVEDMDQRIVYCPQQVRAVAGEAGVQYLLLLTDRALEPVSYREIKSIVWLNRWTRDLKKIAAVLALWPDLSE